MQTFLPRPRRFEPLSGTVDLSGVTRESLRNWTTVQPEAFRCSESYRIHLSEDRKQIELGSEAAFRFAWDHLQQWMGSHPQQTQCGCLEDGPALPHRGFMLDISRCKIPSMETFRELIRQLGAFRYNELQLYMEHSFAYEGHTPVWAEASPITAREIETLHRWCAEAGIRLVPNQNSFGHFERWLKHPEYRAYAECPDGFQSPWGDWRKTGSVLIPDRKSAELVHNLHDQLLPCFPDADEFNIGCDETFELGQGVSKDRCERESRQAVYVAFVRGLADRVAEQYGKRCQFWADILLQDPGWLEKLRPDMIALNWGYEADHPFERECAALRNAGLSFRVCPGTSSWNSFAGRTDNMIPNIRNALTQAVKTGSGGMLLTDWGDNGHLQPWDAGLPGIAWAGLCSWGLEQANESDAWTWCDRHGAPEGGTANWLSLGRISSDLNNGNAMFRMFQGTKEVREIETPRILDMLDRAGSHAVSGERSAQAIRNLALGAVTELRVRGEKAEPDPDWLQAPGEHARLWKQRNREGGLAESLSAYHHAAEFCNLPQESMKS